MGMFQGFNQNILEKVLRETGGEPLWLTELATDGSYVLTLPDGFASGRANSPVSRVYEFKSEFNAKHFETRLRIVTGRTLNPTMVPAEVYNKKFQLPRSERRDR